MLVSKSKIAAANAALNVDVASSPGIFNANTMSLMASDSTLLKFPFLIGKYKEI